MTLRLGFLAFFALFVALGINAAMASSDPIGDCHRRKCTRGEPVFAAMACICGEYPQ